MVKKLCLKDFESDAKERLDSSVYGYFSAGADDEITLRNNIKALSKIQIFPRVLKDMSSISLKCKILGSEMNLPFGIAPAAMQKLIHAEGELLGAKESYEQGTAYGLSMLSTTRLS